MHNFAVNELTKRDFFASLGIWIVLEFVCFFVFPRIGLIEPSDRLRTWVLMSLPLGLGGAIAMAVGSRLLALADDEYNRAKRGSRMTLGQISGGLGIIGILFPFVVTAYEFLVTAAARVSES